MRLPIGAKANFQRPHRAPKRVSVFQSRFWRLCSRSLKNFHPAAFVASSRFCHNKIAHGWSTSGSVPFTSWATKVESLKSQEFCNPTDLEITLFSLEMLFHRNQFNLLSLWICVAGWSQANSKYFRISTYFSHECRKCFSTRVQKRLDGLIVRLVWLKDQITARRYISVLHRSVSLGKPCHFEPQSCWMSPRPFWPDSAIKATVAARLLSSVSHVEDITL